jgi:acetyl-CoA carboxylase biotin carboxyl carrier protein
MTNQELFALMDRFDAGRAVTLKLTQGNFSLELSKVGSAAPASVQPAAPLMAEAAPEAAPAASGDVLSAPLVGTYYAASAPDAAPFVSVGDTVSKGQPVCLIEAMKLMNEIAAPCDCVVEELFCQDGQLVEFDTPLLRYRPV